MDRPCAQAIRQTDAGTAKKDRLIKKSYFSVCQAMILQGYPATAERQVSSLCPDRLFSCRRKTGQSLSQPSRAADLNHPQLSNSTAEAETQLWQIRHYDPFVLFSKSRLREDAFFK